MSSIGENITSYLGSMPLWWRNWRTLPVGPWVRAAGAFRRGDFTLAAREYESGLKRYPHHPARFSARLDLAFCCFKNREFDSAEKHLRYVIGCRPDIKESYLRLARLQLWIGHRLDAAWTMRRAANRLGADPTIAALFLIATLESKAPAFLLEEAVSYADSVKDLAHNAPLLRAAQARFLMIRGVKAPAREALAELVRSSNCPIEAFLYYAELLLDEGEIEAGTEVLKRALHASPNHPQLLSFIANTYLLPGENYSPSFAVQLATSACQETAWKSPREMHTLALAYLAQNNRGAALIVAEKAHSIGVRLLGSYTDIRGIERLINDLSETSSAMHES